MAEYNYTAVPWNDIYPPLHYTYVSMPFTTTTTFSYEYPAKAPIVSDSLASFRGWICPRCGRVWNPAVEECYHCNEQEKGPG